MRVAFSGLAGGFRAGSVCGIGGPLFRGVADGFLEVGPFFEVSVLLCRVWRAIFEATRFGGSRL